MIRKLFNTLTKCPSEEKKCTKIPGDQLFQDIKHRDGGKVLAMVLFTGAFDQDVCTIQKMHLTRALSDGAIPDVRLCKRVEPCHVR